MDPNQTLTLEVVEILHYCSDVNKAVEFYHGKLGWPMIWEFKGSMAGIDAGGGYLLTLVGANFVEGWEAGSPVPTPKLALKSMDLEADSSALQTRGLAALEITGDAATMLSADLPSVEGIEIFVWQDTVDSPATKVVVDYKANRQPEAIYNSGECMFFVNSKVAAEAFFTSKLGFEITERHGDAYCAMKLNGGPILGLYDRSQWWEKPAPGTAPAPARLMLESTDISVEHSRQTEAGVNPGMLEDNSKGLRWFNITDPDGNETTVWQFNSHTVA